MTGRGRAGGGAVVVGLALALVISGIVPALGAAGPASSLDPSPGPPTTSRRLSSPAPSLPTTSGRRPRFRVDSPFIRDRFGRVRFFHGVNAVWKLAPYRPPSTLFGASKDRSYFDRRDARFLARNGLNTVRLGVLFVGVEPTRDDFDDSYLRKMERLSTMLERRGIAVVVDFHQDMYNERYDGEGFPDWATIDDGLPATNCCGFPGNYFTPAVRRAFDNLWQNRDRLWREYANAWKHVAAAFRDHRNLLGYDLLNEPWPGSQAESCANPEGCPLFDTQFLQPFFERVIRDIREKDPSKIIWWDPHVITNSGARNNIGMDHPIRDPGDNNGISFHVYCIAGSPTTGIRPGDDPSCPRSEPIAFNNQRDAARRNGSSLLLSEFGASDDMIDIRRVTRLADKHMTSWQYWHYGNWKDPTTTGTGGAQGLFRNDLRRFSTLKRGKARLLVRTYPQKVAGTPVSFRFRPLRTHRLFKLTYRARPRIDAPTVIYVPVHRHYKNGYRVRVDGPARVLSGPRARYLRVRNTGRGRVLVRVTRR